MQHRNFLRTFFAQALTPTLSKGERERMHNVSASIDRAFLTSITSIF
jgi:hypothetical protein